MHGILWGNEGSSATLIDSISARTQPSLIILECGSSASKTARILVHRCAFQEESQEQTLSGGIKGFRLACFHKKWKSRKDCECLSCRGKALSCERKNGEGDAKYDTQFIGNKGCQIPPKASSSVPILKMLSFTRSAGAAKASTFTPSLFHAIIGSVR